jgi:hypothetical protein
VVCSFHFLAAKEFKSKVHLDERKGGFGLLFYNITMDGEGIRFVTTPVTLYRHR